MAWSFRKRIKVIPGIYLNIGKNGISTTIGVKGASINIGKQGTYLNTGIPGTGLYNRQKLSLENSKQPEELEEKLPSSHVVESKESKIKFRDQNDNIFSLDAEEITSQDMQGIKDTILSAHTQRQELWNDLKTVQLELQKNESKLFWSYCLLYGFLLREKTKTLKQDIISQKQAIEQIKQQAESTAVQLDFEFDEEMQIQYSRLYDSFNKLSNCKNIWDITSEYANDQFATRSAASASVMRKSVSFKTGHLPEIKSQTPAMIWDNANGADLYFYPNFMIVWNNREHFAIVSYNELQINFIATRFIETEKVPSDTRIIDQTWFKVNKNGTPDKRFKANYQIPIVRYGDIELRTETGLNERYLFSNYEHTEEFNLAFLEYQIELIKLE
ncbi:DUF4236 domain-containing protein [Pedobacter glucosidilyticus]|uniref:DUF4236 domain-containing protein n=1 Tax=Pedobacter glucosidilyticus TaxID=1122941 RepID=UPI00040609C0|nr:DUF4236 domain-containing protein [Pedobacter glucosidilyticus]